MKKLITYRCENVDCRKKFPWDPTDGYPQACPHCGYKGDEPDDNVVSMPAFLSAKTKANDDVIKKTIDGSAERALLAAQMSGESIHDMNVLKLNDLQNDGTAKAPANEVSTYMDQNRIGGFNAPAPLPATAPPSDHVQTAMALAAQAHVGRDHHAGARAMGSLQKALFKV